ncbi:hypothetical protein J5N97_013193 [Dioscorea zingiberensis]|uniref:Uncharacterized protein n=1 Tax=Dioscorea zingiberensis TaxID=325984 RepID=A0A9D5HII9_9LILI|nr:hypothetical protein J5N97_013193 [Dioscorea zingiberensis]
MRMGSKIPSASGNKHPADEASLTGKGKEPLGPRKRSKKQEDRNVGKLPTKGVVAQSISARELHQPRPDPWNLALLAGNLGVTLPATVERSSLPIPVASHSGCSLDYSSPVAPYERPALSKGFLLPESLCFVSEFRIPYFFSAINWYRRGRKWNKTAIPVLIGTKFDDFVQLPLEMQWTVVNEKFKRNIDWTLKI